MNISGLYVIVNGGGVNSTLSNPSSMESDMLLVKYREVSDFLIFLQKNN